MKILRIKADGSHQEAFENPAEIFLIFVPLPRASYEGERKSKLPVTFTKFGNTGNGGTLVFEWPAPLWTDRTHFKLQTAQGELLLLLSFSFS